MSPATQLCVDNGQAGNLAAGLLLLALAPTSRAFWIAPLAATLLTLKPQLGLFLPLFWALERRWRDIAITAALVIAQLAIAVLVFGRPSWDAYLGEALLMLSALECYGTGPFTAMIPSVFMSLRLVTGTLIWPLRSMRGLPT
ncbi:MAG: glycosyltransferase 87 family protein [Candidatus Devosia euplotis]|nr:glycosyltransferase 87 family protein [Candidatus Devosia euplotis]